MIDAEIRQVRKPGASLSGWQSADHFQLHPARQRQPGTAVGNGTREVGAGIDTGVFSVRREQESMVKTASGQTVQSGSTGKHLPIDIERLEFS